MFIHSESPASPGVMEKSRLIDTPAFLTRIAEDMRTKSGSDLPLSCFVEQVKLQLAGGKTPEELVGNVNRPSESSLSECYRVWALRD